MIVLRMAGALHVDIPEEAFVVALKPRLRVWREMITKYRRGKPREHLLKIISKLAKPGVLRISAR